MIDWFVRTRVPAHLLTALLLIGGLFAAPQLQREVIPTLDLQRVQVSVAYPGAGPDEVEGGVLVSVENAIGEIEGVEQITSLGFEGLGLVIAEIDTGYELRPIMERIDSQVSGLTGLPDGAERPIISELELEIPAIYLTFYGDASERTLKNLGVRARDELLSMPEITRARLTNVRADEISIELSEAAMSEYDINFDQVAEIIRRSSLNVPAGELQTGAGGILLRTKTKATTGDEFSRIELITRPDGTVVRLGDVATVNDGFAETDREVRFNGKPAVTIAVFRVGEQDIIDVTEAVKRYVDDLRPQLPTGIDVGLWRDSSQMFRSRIDTLVTNGLQGLALVFVALLLFMRPTIAFWTTAGILLTFLGTLFGMYLLGISLNMITLFGFILVLGTLVDDAIVVSEAIYVEHRRGMPGPAAAVQGTRRVLWPVIVAVLTNMMTFAPLLFLPGVQAQLWAFVPMVVITAYLVSLVESLYCLPTHLASLTPRQPSANPPWWERVQSFFAEGMEWFAANVYQPALMKTLQWRWVTLAGFFGLMALTIGLFAGGRIQVAYFPAIQSESILIDISLRSGVPVERTREAVEAVEQVVRDLGANVDARAHPDKHDPTIRYIMRSIGQAGDRLGIRQREGTNAAQLFVELAPAERRNVSTDEFVGWLRERVTGIPLVESVSFDASLNQAGADIEIALSSADPMLLRAASDALKTRLARYAGTREVGDSERAPRDEIQFSVLPEAEALGLTDMDLARQIRQGFLGEQVQTVQRGREEVAVVVRYDRASRGSERALENMRITGRQGMAIPLGNAARLETAQSSTSVTRIDGRRTTVVSANVDPEEGDPARIMEGLQQEFLPELVARYPGLGWSVMGVRKEQPEVMAAMAAFGGIGIVVVYCLIAVLFRSYVQALIVFGVLPFAIIGAIFAHVLFGLTLSMLSFAGMVAALGVCVNDSVVLIDYINRARREGMSRDEAIRTAGLLRFRPIVLTTVTTFVGLSALLLEKSTQAQVLIPMATSLAWAVLVTTFICLFLVPVLVSLVWTDQRPEQDTQATEPQSA